MYHIAIQITSIIYNILQYLYSAEAMFYKSIFFYEVSKCLHAWLLFSDYKLLGDVALLQSTSVKSLFSKISFSCDILQGNNTFRACKKTVDWSISPKI